LSTEISEDGMITLLKNADVFSPQALGLKHLLIADKKISAIYNPGDALPDIGQTFDLNGLPLVPGFVDGLVHFAGGGGEGGFGNRTPELSAQEAIDAGVTTLVGALGTDSITHCPANLLGKCRELQAKGLSAFIYSGSYHFPLKTVTQSIQHDILFLPDVIGVGEIALADHRGSVISYEQFLDVAKSVITNASLAGKKGVIFCHYGDSEESLSMLRTIAEKSDVDIQHFIPTHQNRNPHLFVDALAFAAQGGFIDFTTSTNAGLLADGEVKAPRALSIALEHGIPLAHISFSSDANASLPRFNNKGETIGVDTGKISSLFAAVVESWQQHNVPFASALQCITQNPARALGLTNKGVIDVGFDADLVCLSQDKTKVRTVWSQGRMLSECSQLKSFTNNATN